jgi:hypothetical protein
MNRVELLDKIAKAGITGSEQSGALCRLLREIFPEPHFILRRKNYKDMQHWPRRAYVISVYRNDGKAIVERPRWKFGPFQSREMVSHDVQLETHITTVTLGVVSRIDDRCYSDGVSVSGWNSFAMHPGAETAVA